jgi:hypothetical protein
MQTRTMHAHAESLMKITHFDVGAAPVTMSTHSLTRARARSLFHNLMRHRMIFYSFGPQVLTAAGPMLCSPVNGTLNSSTRICATNQMAAILSTQLEFGAGVALCAVTGEQFVDLLLHMSAHRIYAINCCVLIAPQSSGLFREQGEVLHTKWDGTELLEV